MTSRRASTPTLPGPETERLRLRAPRPAISTLRDFCASDRSVHEGGPRDLHGSLASICGRRRRPSGRCEGYGRFVVEDRATGAHWRMSAIYHGEGFPEPELGWSSVTRRPKARASPIEAATAARDWAFDAALAGPRSSATSTRDNARSHRAWPAAWAQRDRPGAAGRRSGRRGRIRHDLRGPHDLRLRLPIPALTTDRLTLREPREADFPAMLAFNDSPRTQLCRRPAGPPLVWRGLLANIGHWALRGYGFYLGRYQGGRLHRPHRRDLPRRLARTGTWPGTSTTASKATATAPRPPLPRGPTITPASRPSR